MDAQATEVTPVVEAPFLLTPATVADMIEKRDEQQAAKFRTTCSDCVPNL